MSAHFIQTPQPDWGEIASEATSLLSMSLMTILFGIKTYRVEYRYLTYSRWLILALYLFSWAFTTSSTVLVSTNNNNYLSCYLSIMGCDIFYAATKLTIYAWLVEKVWVVSSVGKKRWNSWKYRLHCLMMMPYLAILVLMIVFHYAEQTDTGECIIGLAPIASIPLMVYDFIFNLYMTILFVTPLMKVGKSVSVDWTTSRLHDVARRTLVASIVCLLVSLANILAIVLLDGRERGVLCLTCCTVDVTINVVTIHWVTTHTITRTTKANENKVDSLHSHEQCVHRVDSKTDMQNPLQSKFTNDISSLAGQRADRPYQSRYVTITDVHVNVAHHDSRAASSIQEYHGSQQSLTKPSL